MNTPQVLHTLARQIEILAAQVEPIGHISTPQARFDSALFSVHGTRLRDYLAEIRQNFQHLQRVVADQRTAQVSFIAEKLVAQISALQRELATLTLRQASASVAAPQDIYVKLAEHQHFERRLISMIEDRESLLGQQTTLLQQQKIQQELAALEGRLARCRQALARIERNIEKKENDF